MRPHITHVARPDGQRSVHGHIAPPPALAPYLETIWYSEGPLDAPRERVLPCATADLIFNLGAPMRLLEGTGDALICGATLSGLILQPLLIAHPPIHRAIGLRLRPLGVRALLGIPIRAALDLTAPLDAIWRADPITAQLAEARDPASALERAMLWALDRLARGGGDGDTIAAWAARMIEQRAGVLSIKQLQERSGYGATRFIARFGEELGVTPKVYARLVRFRRALDLLGPDTPLVQTALDAGFTDQPHLCAEFRALAHHTPSEILARRHSSGLTLAEQ